MTKEHRYKVYLRWTGDDGVGTAAYSAYSRTYDLHADGKDIIAGSSDPAFRGDPARWNPEELLIGALSACHQLWYLHLCASAGVTVLAYVDHAEGVMEEEASGAGQFTRIVLRPQVTVASGSDSRKAESLHEAAGRMCFIERTLNCQVACEPTITLLPG